MAFSLLFDLPIYVLDQTLVLLFNYILQTIYILQAIISQGFFEKKIHTKKDLVLG